MSCCGNKRKAYQREHLHSTSQVNTPTPDNSKEQKSKTFEYTGLKSKKIIGSSSGRIYYFRFTGHRIVVPYADTFAMMAESELKVFTK